MKTYQTDLTNNQWNTIVKIILDNRKRKYDLQLIVNALFYLVKTGCQWRMLPASFPKWTLVYYYFSKWKRDGTFDLIMSNLRSNDSTIGIIDSQSVRVGNRAEDKGYDGNKKIKGRKRHIVVNSEGNLLSVKVHNAGIHDSKAALEVIKKTKEDHLKLTDIYADGGYRGELKDHVKSLLKCNLHIILRHKIKKFIPLPKRWVVERTFAWLLNFRRLAIDFELKTCSAEAMVKIAAIKLLLNKI